MIRTEHTSWCAGDSTDCTPAEAIHATPNHDVTTLDGAAAGPVSVWLAQSTDQAAVWVSIGIEHVRLDAEHADLLARKLTEHAAKLREVVR